MVTHLSDDATRMRASSALPIARNTALLRPPWPPTRR